MRPDAEEDLVKFMRKQAMEEIDRDIFEASTRNLDMKKSIVVYLMCPYSIGPKEKNVEQAIHYAEKLVNLGFYPYIPILNHAWSKLYKHGYQFWMNYDDIFLQRCDCGVWNREETPGESRGAEQEWRRLGELFLPRFSTTEELLEYKFKLELHQPHEQFASKVMHGLTKNKNSYETFHSTSEQLSGGCISCGADPDLKPGPLTQDDRGWEPN